MTPFEALYRRRCRSPVDRYEVGEFALLGLDSIYEYILKVIVIRDRLKASQNKIKFYAKNRKRNLEFALTD